MGIFASVTGPRPGPTHIGRVIAEDDYVEEEYVVSGGADLFTYDDDWRPVLHRGDVPFTTRILVRRPRDTADANGAVVIEPLHPAGDMASAWPRLGRMLTRERWSWVGITQDQMGLAATRSGDPERYSALDIPEVGLGYDIVAQVASWLHTGAVDGVALDHLFMTGASYTGTFQRVFLGEGFHERARRPDGGPAVDGYLIQISSGAFMLGGYNPLSTAAGQPPAGHRHRVIQPRDVPVIELLSEGEAETNLASRRPDSDDPGDRYRLYEVAGACHMSAGEATSSLLPATVETPSTFPMFALGGAALHNLRRWAVDGIAPPRADRIELLDDPDAGPHGIAPEALPVARDEHGNARGGVRTPDVDTPIAAYYPHSTLPHPVEAGPSGRPTISLGEIMGSMTPFPDDELRRLYGTPEGYLAAYRKGVDDLVAEGWILAADGGRMIARAADVTF